MALNLKTIQTAIANLITRNNTTTSSYDVSSGLNTRLQAVYIGDPFNSPVPNTAYPVCFVKLISKTEEHRQLGRSAQRSATINFEITPVTMYGMAVGLGGQYSDEEVIVLSQNIENLLRNKITLSGTVSYCLNSGTRYEDKVGNDTWNKMAVISLECKVDNTI